MATLNIYDGNAYLAIGTYGFGREDRKTGKKVPLSWSGFPTGGLYSLLRTLIRNLYDYNIIVFDSKSVRKQMDSTYKANRTGNKRDIIAQQAVAYHFLKKAGFQVFKVEGAEGDDLIHKAVKDNIDMFYDIKIFGNDMDLACNIDSKGRVMLQAPSRLSKTVTVQNYREVVNNDYFVPYNSILPFKVFMGDASDHILKPKNFNGKQFWDLFIKQVSRKIPNQQMWSDREVMDWFISVLEKVHPSPVINELRMRADLVYPLTIEENMVAETIQIDRDVLISFAKMFGMKQIVKILTSDKEPDMTLTSNEIFEFKTIKNNYLNDIYTIDEGKSMLDNNIPNVKLDLIGGSLREKPTKEPVDDILDDDNIASQIFLGSNLGDIE